jgi:hypothetical protein
MGAIERRSGNFSRRDSTIVRLRKSGMVFPRVVNVPDEFLDEHDNLVVPEDIGDIPNDELGRYLSIFTALASYYEAVVACADIDYATSQRVVKYIEAKALLDIKPAYKGEPLAERKARRDLIEEVIEAQEWHDTQKAMYTLSSALLRGIEKILFMLSRELTRRGAKTDFNNREDNVLGSSLFKKSMNQTITDDEEDEE